MLYSNYRIPIEPRQTPEGDFRGAIMGQFQTGSRRFYLEAPRKAGNFIKGNRPDLVIDRDLSRSERSIWRVVKTARRATYLILSSRRPDGQDFGTGFILAPAEQPVKLVDYATSGRTTHAAWQVALVEAAPGDIFVVGVRTNQGTTYSCYIVGDNQIIETAKDKLIDGYATQLDQLERTQRHHTTADLQGYWSDILAPCAGNCRLF